MSTRRARIKAVAALPPRRKNQENADAKSKLKDGFEKSVKSPRTPRSLGKTEEKSSPLKSTIRSPPALLPLCSLSKTPVPSTIRSPPALLPLCSLSKTPVPDKVSSPASKNSPNVVEKAISTPKPEKVSSPARKNSPNVVEKGISSTRPEKVSSPARKNSPNVVEKAISTQRPEKVPVITPTPSLKNVFASPQARNSPDRRRTASPLVLPTSRPSSSSETVSKLAPQISSIQDNSDKSGTSNSFQSNDKSGSTPSRDKKNDISDDYSVPSVPESITDETVMDGIVPLQTAKNAPKPIDLLKNEIISECAEVSFDPIVPLPSPSKVRPKLRPVPRLALHRRNSIQGSASESEDESRRALLGGAPAAAPPRQRHDSHTSHSTLQSAPNREANRIRNDSISSSISQVATQPPPASSPVKEKHFANKARRQEMGRRSWCRRREVKRDALTMYDLIFYNPTTNPIVLDEDEVSAKEANAKEAERKAKAQESEEDADDPPPASDAAPVPQIKLGPNGEIMLDEQSLVIKQSDTRKVSSVVREGSWAGGGGRYTRAARTAEWTAQETVRFYRALAAVGTDFTLMAPLFPDRKRRDLYLKFKKEERQNGAQVDKALRSAISWDHEALEQDFKQERAEQAKKADLERQKLIKQREEERTRMRALKVLRVKNSRGNKAMETKTSHDAHHNELTADDFIRRCLEGRSDSSQPTDEPEFILPTLKPPMHKPKPTTPQSFATLTLLNNNTPTQQNKPNNDLATLSRIDPSNVPPQQVTLNEVAGVPSNIETGSLVVLRVNDPSSPTKTMLQTYIAHGAGKLTPVSLPPTFLNSVVGYMKKGTPKSSMSTASSPQLTSPSSIASQDSRSCTPGVIQLNPSPAKRQRHSSFTITPL